MKRYAVGYADFMRNNLQVVIVKADTWKEAVVQAVIDIEGASEAMSNYLSDIPDHEDDAKQYFFDGDALIGWTVI